MTTNRDKLYDGVSHAAWAYFFLYFDINLGSINILPDFVCYLLLWSAIGCLEEEERDLTLLRPLCVLLGVWAGADWVFTLLGGTNAYPRTLILDSEGEITFTMTGSLAYEVLCAEVENAIVQSEAKEEEAATQSGLA